MADGIRGGPCRSFYARLQSHRFSLALAPTKYQPVDETMQIWVELVFVLYLGCVSYDMGLAKGRATHGRQLLGMLTITADMRRTFVRDSSHSSRRTVCIWTLKKKLGFRQTPFLLEREKKRKGAAVLSRFTGKKLAILRQSRAATAQAAPCAGTWQNEKAHYTRAMRRQSAIGLRAHFFLPALPFAMFSMPVVAVVALVQRLSMTCHTVVQWHLPPDRNPTDNARAPNYQLTK